MKVFVTGASGYVGGAILRRLLADGHEVVALQRRGTDRPLHNPQISVVEGDLFRPSEWDPALDSCDAVIHLVGIIRERPRQNVTMRRIHMDGTRIVVEAAKRATVRKFVHMSALGARAGAASSYHQTKWEAEQLVRNSGLDYTIFRPSVIFGPGGPGPEFVGMLARLIAKAPVVPLIGDGRFELQPVSVETVAEAFSKALTWPCAVNKTYELGGPERMAYVDILRAIATAHGKRLRTVSIPVSLMKRIVPILERIPAFPLSNDQLTMLLEGNVTRQADIAYRDLDLRPIPFKVDPTAAHA
jgi:uncharacterized protein YbjT (DUF2867 family)